MTLYCVICGNELKPEEEEEGVCESCKLSQTETPEEGESAA